MMSCRLKGIRLTKITCKIVKLFEFKYSTKALLIKSTQRLLLNKHNSNYYIHSILKMEKENNSICQKLYQIKKPIVSMNFELTDVEKEIFSVVLNTLKENNLTTTCRVAGGWVRDKLLGRKSDDIDIALDNISGEKLARLINDKLYVGKDKVGVVKSNPDKSKHLETATMKIADHFVDFVNLRTESYSVDSRVPNIGLGTPYEDAERRDITINTLFYNINTEKIEDHLGLGIKDLENGFIRTPLHAEITFQDDPLRILRTVRFATRFSFELDTQIIEASKSKEIKKALREKISNERIRKELSGMFCGPLPCASVKLLYMMHILEDILKVPNEIVSIEEEERLIRESVNISFISSFFMDINNTYYNILKDLHIIKNHEQSDFRERIFFFCITRPYDKVSIKVKKETMTLSTYLLKTSFVGTNEDMKVSLMFDSHFNEFINLVNEYHGSKVIDRLRWGLFIRKVGFINLKFFFIYGAALDYRQSTIDNTDILIETIDIEKYNNTYHKFKFSADMLLSEELLHIDELKPLIDGAEIAKYYNIKPGKILGLLLQKCIEIQIDNPKISKDELREKLDKIQNE